MADKRTDEEKIADPRDWRGTAIKVGDPVIYGAPVGRSIELVEGEVTGFSKTGRVNVQVIRRAYSHAGSWGKRNVHVGQDRLTVIRPDSLPPTTLPTWEEAIEQTKKRAQEREDRYNSHTWPDVVETPLVTRDDGWGRQIVVSHATRFYPPCEVCGTPHQFASSKACEPSDG